MPTEQSRVVPRTPNPLQSGFLITRDKTDFRTERSYGVSSMATYERRTEEEAVKLTKREIEVLTLVIEGKSSKEVADMLFVSKRTVDFHLANIYDKLQVSNRVQAFRRAARLGLIPFESQFAES